MAKPNILNVVGCMLFVFLIVGAYNPLHSITISEGFQAWAYGPMVSNMLPVFLSGLAVLFVAITVKIEWEAIRKR